MKDMKKTRISALLLIGMVLLVPCGCENGKDDLRITLETDYNEVLSTIEQSSRLLSEQMARIESLMRQGLADNQSAVEQIRQAVAALGGTLEDKLSAIESAIKSETSSLETKLALVEEAAAGIGTGEQELVLEQIRQAIESLGGDVSNRISAIERTIASQTTSLAAKVDLIAAAVEEGFLADTAAVHAMKKALDTSLGSLDADLSAVKDDIVEQYVGLDDNLLLNCRNNTGYQFDYQPVG